MTDQSNHPGRRVPAGVGTTALLIAALRADESRRPGSLFGTDPLAEAVRGEVGADTARLWVEDGVPTTLADNLRDYVAVRTRYFDDYLARATADGARQVVVLGAGLDGRAHRLALPGATLFEVDSAEVLDFKRWIVDRHGLEQRTPQRPVVADLADDDAWPHALADAGFDRAAPTAWLAEGLLFYLPADDCDRLVRTVTGLSAPGSHLAVEYPEGDMGAVMVDIDSRPGTTAMFGPLLESGPQQPPAQWLDRAGWSVDAVDVAGWASGLGHTLPWWSTLPGFTWWFARAGIPRRASRSGARTTTT